MSDVNPDNNRDTFRGRGARIKELEEQVAMLQQRLTERPAMTEDEMAKEIGQMSDEEVKANVDRVFGDDLARRAVKCNGWRWMPGMLADRGRVCSVAYMHKWLVVYDDCTEEVESFYNADPEKYAIPDLRDQATLGCLLHLVRDHWGDDVAGTRRVRLYGGGEQWVCCAPSIAYPTLQTHGATEAEALVKALELEVSND